MNAPKQPDDRERKRLIRFGIIVALLLGLGTLVFDVLDEGALADVDDSPGAALPAPRTR